MLIGLTNHIGVEDCSFSVSTEEEEACRRKADAAEAKYLAMTVGGAVSLGVGLAGILVSFFINPHPVTTGEQRELADRYNKKLRQRLKLEDHAAETESLFSLKPKPKPTAAPLLGPYAAGISVGLVF